LPTSMSNMNVNMQGHDVQSALYRVGSQSGKNI
jgi:hypothetical protein